MTAPQIHEQECRAHEYVAPEMHCHCHIIRADRSDQIPDRPVHWTWLMGPAERPDPSPVEMFERQVVEERKRKLRWVAGRPVVVDEGGLRDLLTREAAS